MIESQNKITKRTFPILKTKRSTMKKNAFQHYMISKIVWTSITPLKNLYMAFEGAL